MRHGLKSWLEGLLAFFYPEVCQLCHVERATVDEGYIGPHCRQRVRWIKPPFCERCGLPFAGEITTSFECKSCGEMKLSFLWARAAVVARDVALEAIHRYKYQRALWFEPFLAGLLVQQARPLLGTHNCDLLVPVPLHPLKQREREFNQAERLARRLGQAVNLPVHTRLLQRVRPTRTQTQLSRVERAANVRRAFAVRPGMALHGERVVVVDDVMTTGATTNACAEALLAAGAGSVAVWTVARGV